MVEVAADRPTQRGLLCVYGFFAFLFIGALMLTVNPQARSWPVLVFATSVVALLGTSALYHRVRWSPTWYARVRRVDHAMIFVLITGTETPLFRIALAERDVDTLFYVALGVAGAGFLITMIWVDAPKWVRAVVYVLVGWSGIMATPELADVIGLSGVAMLVLGGALYTVGALAYAFKWPDPLPGRFGYHEVFHAFVLAAVGVHYAAIAFWVLG